MLSIACDVPTTTQEAEPQPALPMRRLAVTFDRSARRRRSVDKSDQGGREMKRASVSVPSYSRIVFRAGSVSVR